MASNKFPSLPLSGKKEPKEQRHNTSHADHSFSSIAPPEKDSTDNLLLWIEGLKSRVDSTLTKQQTELRQLRNVSRKDSLRQKYRAQVFLHNFDKLGQLLNDTSGHEQQEFQHEDSPYPEVQPDESLESSASPKAAEEDEDSDIIEIIDLDEQEEEEGEEEEEEEEEAEEEEVDEEVDEEEVLDRYSESEDRFSMPHAPHLHSNKIHYSIQNGRPRLSDMTGYASINLAEQDLRDMERSESEVEDEEAEESEAEASEVGEEEASEASDAEVAEESEVEASEDIEPAEESETELQIPTETANFFEQPGMEEEAGDSVVVLSSNEEGADESVPEQTNNVESSDEQSENEISDVEQSDRSEDLEEEDEPNEDHEMFNAHLMHDQEQEAIHETLVSAEDANAETNFFLANLAQDVLNEALTEDKRLSDYPAEVESDGGFLKRKADVGVEPKPFPEADQMPVRKHRALLETFDLSSGQDKAADVSDGSLADADTDYKKGQPEPEFAVPAPGKIPLFRTVKEESPEIVLQQLKQTEEKYHVKLNAVIELKHELGLPSESELSDNASEVNTQDAAEPETLYDATFYDATQMSIDEEVERLSGELAQEVEASSTGETEPVTQDMVDQVLESVKVAEASLAEHVVGPIDDALLAEEIDSTIESTAAQALAEMAEPSSPHSAPEEKVLETLPEVHGEEDIVMKDEDNVYGENSNSESQEAQEISSLPSETSPKQEDTSVQIQSLESTATVDEGVEQEDAFIQIETVEVSEVVDEDIDGVESPAEASSINEVQDLKNDDEKAESEEMEPEQEVVDVEDVASGNDEVENDHDFSEQEKSPSQPPVVNGNNHGTDDEDSMENEEDTRAGIKPDFPVLQQLDEEFANSFSEASDEDDHPENNVFVDEPLADEDVLVAYDNFTEVMEVIPVAPTSIEEPQQVLQFYTETELTFEIIEDLKFEAHSHEEVETPDEIVEPEDTLDEVNYYETYEETTDVVLPTTIQELESMRNTPVARFEHSVQAEVVEEVTKKRPLDDELDSNKSSPLKKVKRVLQALNPFKWNSKKEENLENEVEVTETIQDSFAFQSAQTEGQDEFTYRTPDNSRLHANDGINSEEILFGEDRGSHDSDVDYSQVHDEMTSLSSLLISGTIEEASEVAEAISEEIAEALANKISDDVEISDKEDAEEEQELEDAGLGEEAEQNQGSNENEEVEDASLASRIVSFANETFNNGTPDVEQGGETAEVSSNEISPDVDILENETKDDEQEHSMPEQDGEVGLDGKEDEVVEDASLSSKILRFANETFNNGTPDVEQGSEHVEIDDSSVTVPDNGALEPQDQLRADNYEEKGDTVEEDIIDEPEQTVDGVNDSIGAAEALVEFADQTFNNDEIEDSENATEGAEGEADGNGESEVQVTETEATELNADAEESDVHADDHFDITEEDDNSQLPYSQVFAPNDLDSLSLLVEFPKPPKIPSFNFIAPLKENLAEATPEQESEDISATAEVEDAGQIAESRDAEDHLELPAADVENGSEEENEHAEVANDVEPVSEDDNDISKSEPHQVPADNAVHQLMELMKQKAETAIEERKLHSQDGADHEKSEGATIGEAVAEETKTPETQLEPEASAEPFETKEEPQASDDEIQKGDETKEEHPAAKKVLGLELSEDVEVAPRRSLRNRAKHEDEHEEIQAKEKAPKKETDAEHKEDTANPGKSPRKATITKSAPLPKSRNLRKTSTPLGATEETPTKRRVSSGLKWQLDLLDHPALRTRSKSPIKRTIQELSHEIEEEPLRKRRITRSLQKKIDLMETLDKAEEEEGRGRTRTRK